MRALSPGDTVILDERQMTHGVIPVKQSSLPGLIRLPRRYETDSVKVPVYSNHLTAIQPTCPENESLSERLNDLMLATMWVKQELILLRQHDILLKRQFFNIHHSITSLQPNKIVSNTVASTQSPSSSSSTFATNVDTNKTDITASTELGSSTLSNHSNSEALLLAQNSRPFTKLGSNPETLLVRPVTYSSACSDDSSGDDDSDRGDVFFETRCYRRRALSMRTSRDLAATARRRGSKDLI